MRPSRKGVEPPAPIATGNSFGISSLMMVIALLAVCLGVGHESPGLGIALVIASAPALIRTAVVASWSRGRGQPMPASAKLWTFLASLAGVVVVFLSAALAFVATCFPVGAASFRADSPSGIIVAFILGAVAAVAASVFTYRLIRRLRDRGSLS